MLMAIVCAFFRFLADGQRRKPQRFLLLEKDELADVTHPMHAQFPWAHDSYNDFKSIVESTAFPCFFARKAPNLKKGRGPAENTARKPYPPGFSWKFWDSRAKPLQST